MKKKTLCNYQPQFPMNLQFFADEAPGDENITPPDTSSDMNEDSETKEKTEPQKTYEDALAEIAAAQAEAKKAKADRDAALKKSGELTKQLRAKMTEAEIEAEKVAQEKEEHDAYVKDLESFKRKTEAKDRYTSIFGKDLTDPKLVAELAEKAAEAETKGDMEALADVNSQFLTVIRKQDRAKFMGDRGRVNMGDGEEPSMTREEIFAIADNKERQEAIRKNFKLFENH